MRACVALRKSRSGGFVEVWGRKKEEPQPKGVNGRGLALCSPKRDWESRPLTHCPHRVELAAREGRRSAALAGPRGHPGTPATCRAPSRTVRDSSLPPVAAARGEFADVSRPRNLSRSSGVPMPCIAVRGDRKSVV